MHSQNSRVFKGFQDAYEPWFYENTKGSQGNLRFHPYQQQRNDFLYKGRPQKSRIKKEGDSKQA